MVVRVRESLTSSEYETYTYYDNLVNVTNESRVYYLQENANGQYEFYFGDGVLGYKLTTGQIVELTYVSTNGLEGNGSKEFSANSSNVLPKICLVSLKTTFFNLLLPVKYDKDLARYIYL